MTGTGRVRRARRDARLHTRGRSARHEHEVRLHRFGAPAFRLRVALCLRALQREGWPRTGAAQVDDRTVRRAADHHVRQRRPRAGPARRRAFNGQVVQDNSGHANAFATVESSDRASPGAAREMFNSLYPGLKVMVSQVYELVATAGTVC